MESGKLHFKACDVCGTHGCFVFSDGSKGLQIVSKREGLQDVQRFIREGKIPETEGPVLAGEIEDSPLPAEPCLKKRIAKRIDELMNTGATN